MRVWHCGNASSKARSSWRKNLGVVDRGAEDVWWRDMGAFGLVSPPVLKARGWKKRWSWDL